MSRRVFSASSLPVLSSAAKGLPRPPGMGVGGGERRVRSAIHRRRLGPIIVLSSLSAFLFAISLRFAHDRKCEKSWRGVIGLILRHIVEGSSSREDPRPRLGVSSIHPRSSQFPWNLRSLSSSSGSTPRLPRGSSAGEDLRPHLGDSSTRPEALQHFVDPALFFPS